MKVLTHDNLTLETYRTGTPLIFDLETTNIDYGDPRRPDNWVVMVSWQLGWKGKVHDHYGAIMDCRAFWEALEEADYVIAQNIKFECGWLLRLGYDPTDLLWYDTMLGEKVRMGNRMGQERRVGLDATARRYGYKGKETRVDAQMKAGVCPSDIDSRFLRARCRRDVKTTAQVARKQMRHLHKTGRLHLALTRSLFAPILADYERQGMCLSKERVYEEYAKYSAKRAEVQEQLDKFTGSINLNSSDQLAHFLYGGGLVEVKTKVEVGTYKNGNPKFKVEIDYEPDDAKTLGFPEMTDGRGRPRRNAKTKRWPEGKPKTDKNTIEWLKARARTKAQIEFFRLLGEYSQVNAALVKNLEFFKGVVDERDQGIFFGQFRQDTTATHRLSGRGMPQEFEQFEKPKSVQFQNMPRVFKRLFKSRDPDYDLVETDGSQLEFRVAAFLGQDGQAMDDIQNPDFDAHVTSASVMAAYDYAELLAAYRSGDKEAKALRQDAKSETFKPLYGGQKGTPEQERWYKEFQRRYSELYEVQNGWVDEVLGNGYMTTPWGMRFYFDFYLHGRSGVPMDSKKHKSIVPSVFNYPVQSLATAEIIPIAAVYLYHRVKAEGLRVRFVNTVHDSVIAEVHKEDLEAYKRVAQIAFTSDVYRYLSKVYNITFNVPLGCETGWGEHWSEGEEEAYERQPEEVLRVA
jgi:DNA polymerase I-like protein with 3'-5' exonuclease and polymerase domains